MADRHWSTSVPVSQHSAHFYTSGTPASPRPEATQLHNIPGGGRQHLHRGYPLFSSPYASTSVDARPFGMPTYGNMSSADLVAAALTPTHVRQPTQNSAHPSGVTSDISTPRNAGQDVNTYMASSPLTYQAGEDFSSETERRIQKIADIQHAVRKRKRQPSQFSESGESCRQNANADCDTTDVVVNNPSKISKTRRSSRSRRSFDDEQESDEEYEDAAESRRKVTRKSKAPKPAPKRLIRKKPHGIRVPDKLEAATPPDKMMWEWKNAGRNWEDIRVEWARLTGTKPGQSSLSVRYIKLNENFARNGAAGDQELLRFKEEAEEELLSGLWEKVAEKMVAFNAMSEHNPKDLKRRYDLIARSNFDLVKVAQEDKLKQEDIEKKEPNVTLCNKAEDDPGMSQVEMLHADSSTPAQTHDQDEVSQKVEDAAAVADCLAQSLPEFTDGASEEAAPYGTDGHIWQSLPHEEFTDDHLVMEWPRQGTTQQIQGMSDLPLRPTTPTVASPLSKGLVFYGSDSD